MDEQALPEAVAALTALARSWQQEGSASSGTRSHPMQQLLEQLLSLSGAQRGALLLVRAPSPAHEGGPPPAHTSLGGVRTLAQRGVSEEELLLLTPWISTGAERQRPAQTPGWRLSRLPLAAAPARRAAGPAELFSAASLPPAQWPAEALLVLGWEARELRPSLAAQEPGGALSPLVAEVAGLLLSNLLLCERLEEREEERPAQTVPERDVLFTELLATVSHALRSPLTAIKGPAETLLRLDQRTSRKVRHELLQIIKEASDELAAVIDHLLEAVQLETGDLRIKRMPVNVVQVVREALTTAQERLRATEQCSSPSQAHAPLIFTLHLQDQQGQPTCAEPLIPADRHRVRQVLDELLANAIAYSPNGGTIDVTIRPLSRQALMERGPYARPAATSGQGKELPSSRAEQPQQGVELSISDQGRGIPAEQIEHIFERFHRLDITLSRPVHGLGLGLAICQRLVELHEGMIWAESEGGAGSAFHVWLPAASQEKTSLQE